MSLLQELDWYTQNVAKIREATQILADDTAKLRAALYTAQSVGYRDEVHYSVAKDVFDDDFIARDLDTLAGTLWMVSDPDDPSRLGQLKRAVEAARTYLAENLQSRVDYSEFRSVEKASRHLWDVVDLLRAIHTDIEDALIHHLVADRDDE